MLHPVGVGGSGIHTGPIGEVTSIGIGVPITILTSAVGMTHGALIPAGTGIPISAGITAGITDTDGTDITDTPLITTQDTPKHTLPQKGNAWELIRMEWKPAIAIWGLILILQVRPPAVARHRDQPAAHRPTPLTRAVRIHDPTTRM